MAIVAMAISRVQCPQMQLLTAVASFISQEMVSFSDVAPTFDQGAHHPTVLVVLQAMVALIGEVRAYLLPCPRGWRQRFPSLLSSCWVASSEWD